MLIVWLRDLMHKNVLISGAAIQQQATDFHEYLREKHGASSTENFSASRGWFDRFRRRFGLHNVAFSGETASADHEAARQFPPVLQKIIDEKSYSRNHIFYCDETGLNLKKMTKRTYSV